MHSFASITHDVKVKKSPSTPSKPHICWDLDLPFDLPMYCTALHDCPKNKYISKSSGYPKL